jgi:DNA-binding HxlR family transcriptional regulator
MKPRKLTPEEILALGHVMKLIKKQFRVKAKILKELYSKEMHISDLSKKTGISYKETYRQTTALKKWGLLTRKKRIGEKHQPVMLKLTKEGNVFCEIIK